MIRIWTHLIASLVLALITFFLAHTSAMAGTEPLTFTELMKFKKIEGATLSRDGSWVAYTLKPDRGDGEAVARKVDDETEHRVAGCSAPQLSGDARWMACTVLPSQEERDTAAGKKKDDDKPRNGMALVSLADGTETHIDEVESFAFSDDGRWIAWKLYKSRDEEDEEQEEEETEKSDEEKEDDDRPVGTGLLLRDLSGDGTIEIPFVTAFSFDEPSRHLAYTTATPDGKENGIHVRQLGLDATPHRAIHTGDNVRISHPIWAEDSSLLGFLAAVDDEDHEPGPADLWVWDGDEPRRRAASEDAPDGWRIPSTNKLTWSRDGERLFFGYGTRKPEESEDESEEDDDPYDPYDNEALLEKRKVDVWHWDDPYIIPNQKKRWDKEEKDRVYLAVLHRGSGKVVRLADPDHPNVTPANNPRAVIGRSSLPYRKEVTWSGSYQDLFHIDLNTGRQRPVAQHLSDGAVRLSPTGRFIVFWNKDHWHLYDAETGSTRNLTESLPVPFADEDDDYPAPDPGYGVADWIEGDRGVLIYDKFDIWRFSVDGEAPVNLTGGQGRKENRRFRVVDLDPKLDHLTADEPLLLLSYHHGRKNFGFYRTRSDRAALKRLVEEDAKFRFIGKAEEADRLLYTRETYNDFPDLRVATRELKKSKRLSTANPQVDRFAWGQAELVEWNSGDGIPLQGVLIKPGNYDPKRRYPVLVYFYRFFSQRLHEFNDPVINHRPSFPLYASNGYAVFLPDVRFEIGRPGLSAVKAVVPGVQKLVEMGVADPDAIGLHGHSWSGYQAAYMITQTDAFAATVAGAPVSNMTSAYSGIRLGSGLARQFQYEQSQSRIGGSMDAELPKYLENSPVFHVRHIKTPLLIQFGDVDEAVPWQQGIELYLAMRRLEKNVIFLQYRDEPHHLKKYPNKLDYSIKMKEFFDHHLKGQAAPPWMTEGVPYQGE